MAANTYYIRLRGQITGPYGAEEVRMIAQRGRVSRIHEISNDQAHWTPFSTWSELQPAAPAPPRRSGLVPPAERPAEVQAVAPPAAAPPAKETESFKLVETGPDPYATAPPPEDKSAYAIDGEVAPETPETPGKPLGEPAAVPLPKPTIFFYSKDGITSQPKNLDEIRSLVIMGQVGPDDPVWRAGAAEARPAAEAPELAPLFAVNSRPAKGPGHLFMLVGSFCIAFVLLVCVNLPHSRSPEGLRWWWQIGDEPHGMELMIVGAYLMLAAIGIVLVGSLLEGAARGAVLTGIGGIGVFLLMGAGAAATRTPGLIILATLWLAGVGVALALPCLQLARPSALPPANVRMMIHGPLVGLSLLLGVVALFDLMTLPTGVTLPGWGIFAVILWVLGQLAASAGNVLGLRDAVRGSSRSLSIAAITTGLAGMFLAAAAACIAGLVVGAASDEAAARFTCLQCVRLVVSVYALIELMGLGVFGSLVSANRE